MVLHVYVKSLEVGSSRALDGGGAALWSTKRGVDKGERCSMCSEMFVKISGKREHSGEVDSFPVEPRATPRSTGDTSGQPRTY